MNVSTTRPRIWLTPAMLPALKARAVPTNDRWVTLQQAAGAASDWNTGIMNYALAYVVTGTPVYAQRAWDLMAQSMAAGVDQVTPDSGYQARNFFPAAAITYDWLSDWLNLPQKTQLRQSIEQCADWIWPETNPTRKGAWAIDDPCNNYFGGFLLTWMAGLALAGDSPKAQGYLDNALAKYRGLVLPALAGPCAGGMTPEGTGYGTVTIMEVLQSLLAHQTATGENLIGTNAFFSDAASALIHLTNPAMTEIAPLGDLAAGPIADRHRLVMLLLAGSDSRPAVWLNSVTPSRCTQRLNAAAEFLWYSGVAIPTGVPRTPPETFYSLPGTGIISSRSGWGKSETQVLFRAGPTRQSHEDRSQGEFLISRDNQWLAGMAKLQSHSGIAQDCWDHNTLSVDGKPQTWTQDGVKILRQEETAAYTYALADVTAAYASQLTVFMREVLFLKPLILGSSAYLLIADGYLPADPTSAVMWHLNTPILPVLMGNRFQAGALFGVAVEPPAAVLSMETVKLAPEQPTSTYRVNVHGDPTGHFLVALEVATATRAVTSLGVPVVTEGLQGIRCQNSFVAWLAGDRTSWVYPSPTVGPHTLVGSPNTVYQTPGGLVTSSPAGILTLPGLPVDQLMTITKGTDPPPPPPPPVVKVYTVSGTVTGQPDGTLTGQVTLRERP